ncbi:hypothetical protein A1O3_06186 [Capronia epimyces CBS 606.96]|uniref:LCCL domain-containing protein n=1 Tax=Capronia epimyces CBS 606.96 TaxID=1182542 RepID=W9XQA6_9EURO|nr:uncharacterized protein A1O3_06186 [Capronia epimyces CBS 606.96]EXJ82373.1 hypothetical protein A1O3_06186 [Capronia epimyces CBS 606.96]
MEPLIESPGRDEEEIAGDHDEGHLLLRLRGTRARRTHPDDVDDGAPVLSDFMRAILPRALQNTVRALNLWLQGPHRPEKQHITPLQWMPPWLQDKLSIKRQGVFVTAIFLAWAISFSAVVWRWSLLPELRGYGQPRAIRCMQQAWSINDNCGLDGVDCRPFSNATFAYHCSPGCATQQVWYPHTVGDQEVVYRQLVVGGASTESAYSGIYRADSSICQAAIHAGVLSDSYGGPVALRLLGEHTGFQAIDRNGVHSVGFDADFPKAFAFISLASTEIGSFDVRWPMLVFSVLVTSLISVFTKSPAAFFTPVFIILFMHVSFVSDKPELPAFAELLSVSAERLLPASFAAFVIYLFCVRLQLSDLTSHFDKTVLWLGAAWFGALENYTLDHIPIRRLTPSDLHSQPGAILALTIIVVLILAIAIGQIYYLRREGRLIRYLKVYALLAGMLVCAAAIPSVHLRIHHYILALLLLPGTAIQTRPSLLYQGLLVGLFINGVARWGFASILQTDAALRDLDGPYGSPLPNVTAVVASDLSAVDFHWSQPPEPYQGLSVLVNDVERYRWYSDLDGLNYTWSSSPARRSRSYFRFAYVADGHAVDYTRAAIWELDGTWNTTLWDL